MKAVVVHGAGDLRVEQRAAPEPMAGEVLLRMTHGGICGSDLSYYRHGAVGDFAVRQPLVLGHEVVGVVAHDPSGRYAVDTPVAIHPATSCGTCLECQAGELNVCRNARYLGSAASNPHTQGGFVELMTVRLDQVRELPARLPLERAVLAEPLGVALHALARAGGVAGAKVLVSGAGPIGLLVTSAAKAAGAQEVWTTDVLDHPLEIARMVGADRTVRVDMDNVPVGYFDVAVEASGSPIASGVALAAARRRGVLVQVGMVPGGLVGIALSPLVSREIDIRGAFRFNTEIDDAIRLLTDTDALDLVITHTFDIDEALAGMRIAANPAVSGKVVLRLS